MFSSKPQKQIELKIMSVVTYDPPQCIIGCSNRYKPSTFVTEIGGAVHECTSFEDLEGSFESARYISAKGGNFTASVEGKIYGKIIDEKFSTFQALEDFFHKNNLLEHSSEEESASPSRP